MFPCGLKEDVYPSSHEEEVDDLVGQSKGSTITKGVPAEKTCPQILPAHPLVTAESSRLTTRGRSFVRIVFAIPMGVSLNQRFKRVKPESWSRTKQDNKHE